MDNDLTLMLAQVLRAICILIGPFCFLLCLRLVFFKDLSKHRRRLYAGSAFLLASAVYTQVERFDDPVTPRLFLATPGILLVFSGLWTMRHYKSRDV